MRLPQSRQYTNHTEERSCQSSWLRQIQNHPFKSWPFINEEVPALTGCLPSFGGPFWTRLWIWLWKQLPKRKGARLPAPEAEDALTVLGVWPQATQLGWRGMDKKRIIVYETEASQHWHLPVYPVSVVYCG